MHNKQLIVNNIKLKSNIFMAPMVGYTPYPFRYLCQKLGAGIAFTEMVSCNALKYKDKSNQLLAYTNENETVKAVQLLGENPNLMKKAALSEVMEPFDIIDINMGCPVPNVIKSGMGCALMENPKTASKIIDVCKSSGKTVSVKFRIGMSKNAIKTEDFAKLCEQSGADMITIHARTRDMMYSGQPFYEEIAKAKAVVKIPVIANGDITSLEKANQVMKISQADGIMVARYALENPFIFSEFTQTNSDQNKYNFITKLFQITKQHYDENYTLKYIKRMSAYLMKRLKGTKKYKLQLFSAGSFEELEDILYLIFKEQD